MFRTCYSSSGKVWKMIVDGGSTNTIFIEETIEKYGLKRLRHTYRIFWFQGEHALEVREQCLVDFIIQ